MKEKDLLKFIDKLRHEETPGQGCGPSLGYLYRKQFDDLELVIRIYFVIKEWCAL